MKMLISFDEEFYLVNGDPALIIVDGKLVHTKEVIQIARFGTHLTFETKEYHYFKKHPPEVLIEGYNYSPPSLNNNYKLEIKEVIYDGEGCCWN